MKGAETFSARSAPAMQWAVKSAGGATESEWRAITPRLRATSLAAPDRRALQTAPVRLGP